MQRIVFIRNINLTHPTALIPGGLPTLHEESGRGELSEVQFE